MMGIEEAIAYYHKILALNPNHEGAKKSLAQAALLALDP